MLLPPGGARNAIDCAYWDLEAKRAGVPMERVFVNVHRYGNMSAATVPVA